MSKTAYYRAALPTGKERHQRDLLDRERRPHEARAGVAQVSRMQGRSAADRELPGGWSCRRRGEAEGGSRRTTLELEGQREAATRTTDDSLSRCSTTWWATPGGTTACSPAARDRSIPAMDSSMVPDVTVNRSSWRRCRCSAATDAPGRSSRFTRQHLSTRARGRVNPGDPLAAKGILDCLADDRHRRGVQGSGALRTSATTSVGPRGYFMVV